MKNVMFVDDEKSLLNSMARMLRPLEDQWQFFYVDSPIKALDLLDTLAVDVIICDMGMPKMTGKEMLSIVHDRHPQIIRVMMTGLSEYEIYREGLVVAQFFLWKPVTPKAIGTLFQLLSDKEVVFELESDDAG